MDLKVLSSQLWIVDTVGGDTHNKHISCGRRTGERNLESKCEACRNSFLPCSSRGRQERLVRRRGSRLGRGRPRASSRPSRFAAPPAAPQRSRGLASTAPASFAGSPRGEETSPRLVLCSGCLVASRCRHSRSRSRCLSFRHCHFELAAPRYLTPLSKRRMKLCSCPCPSRLLKIKP